jgi:uncharacterized phiE125 gp8 family phage protein
MELIETSGVATGDLPVAAFRTHLRMGTGFANDASLDCELAQYLRAAIARIEAGTGKALLRRGYRLVLQAWRTVDAQPLPLAPVLSVEAITLRNRTGAPMPVAPERYRLIGDRHRPQIVASGATLPSIPVGGQVAIEFTAGFGISWDAVPDDLAQAVLILAARFFEMRTGMDAAMPAAVEALIARWTPLRLTAGGHRG